MNSTTIDEKIVKMTFDNSNFDSRIQSSMASLSLFKKELNMDTATNNSDTALKKIADSAKNIDMSSLVNSIQTVGNRFTTLGIIGMNVINKLTDGAINLGVKIAKAIPSQIMTGGWARASNVAQAKFQLEGLGIAWEKVADDIDHAVQDTAYGADAAAKAASQLAASGVAYGGVIETLADGTKVYSDMGRALRGISGTAAMTNSSYEEIADIFTTVAGQGKLMTMQLNQLAGRGLNVAATLADQWGKTEAEVREMVSKGKVHFQDFADAMDSAFGEHATKANETLSGSISNMKASLSRIGQDFAQTILSETPRMFNALKGFFNQIRKYTKPFADDIFTPIFRDNLKKITSLIEEATSRLPKLDAGSTTLANYNRLLESLKNILNGVINVAINVANAFKPIGEAFNSVFSVPSIDKIRDFSLRFLEFSNRIKLSDETFDRLKRTFSGIFSVFDILANLFGRLLSSLSPLIGGFRSLANMFLNVTSSVGDAIVSFDAFIKKSETLDKIFNKIRDVSQKIADAFEGVKIGISSFVNVDTSGVDGLTNRISKRVDSFRESLTKVGGTISKLQPLFSAVFGMIGRIGKQAFEMIGEAINSFASGSAFIDLIDLLKGVMLGDLIYAAVGLVKSLIQIKDTVLAPVNQVKNILLQVKNTLIILQKEVKANIIRSIAISIAILVASLVVLSNVDYTKIVTGLTTMGAMLTGLLIALNSILKTSSAFNMIQINKKGNIFSFFTILKTSIASISEAYAQRMKLVGMGLLLMELASAILILAEAMKIMSTIPADQMVRSAIIVVGLILTLVAVTHSLSQITVKMPKVALTLLSFSASIMILAKALQMIAQIDASALQRSFEALGLMSVIFGTIVTFMSVFGKSMGVGDALTLISFAASILILSVALKSLGELSSEQIAKGLVVVGGLLLELSLAMVLLGEASPLAILGAGAVLIMSASLLVLLPVFKAFSEMDWGKLLSGLAKIALVVTILGTLTAVVGVISPFIAAAAISFTLLGAAFLVLAVGMAALSRIKFEDVANGLASFTFIAVIVTALSVALSIFIPELLLFAAAVGILAVSMALVSATTGLFITEFEKLIGFFEDQAPRIINILVTIIVDICRILAEQILDNSDEIFQSVANVISGLAKALEDAVDILLPALNNLVESIFYAIGVAINDIPEVIKSAIRGLGRGLGCDDAWIQSGEEMIDALWEGLTAPAPWNNLANDLGLKVREVAKNLIDGFANAIRGGKGQISSASDELGRASISSLNKSIDAHSPSRESEKSGKWFVEGFVLGMKNYMGLSEETAKQIGDNTLKSLDESLKDPKKIDKTVNNLKTEIASAFAKKIGYNLNVFNEKDVEKVYDLAIQYEKKMYAEQVNAASAKATQLSLEKAAIELEDRKRKAEEINAASRKATEESVQKAFIANFEKRGKSYEEYVKSVEDGTKKLAFKEKQMNEEVEKSGITSYKNRLNNYQDYLSKLGAPKEVVESEFVKNIERENNILKDRVTITNEEAEAYLKSTRTKMRYLKELDEKNTASYQNEKVLNDFARENDLKLTETKIQNNDKLIKSEQEVASIYKYRSKEEAEAANLQINKQKQKMEIAKTASAMDKKFYDQRYTSETKIAEATNKTYKELEKFDMAEKKAMKSSEQASKSLEKQTKALSETEKAARAAKKEMEQFADSISKDLESKTGGMNFFNKLELKAETSASAILENMKSNVDGVASWTARLSQLMDKGLNKELVKTLADAGLDSYDQISAFLQMTDEQINQANELFLKAAEGRAYAANTISEKYYTLGSDNMQGMIDGIASKKDAVSDEAVSVADEAHKKVEELEGHHSPSEWWKVLGMDDMQGLDIGIIKGFETYVFPNLTYICNRAQRAMKEGMASDVNSEIFNIGMNFSRGLADGILAGEKEIISATKKVTSIGIGKTAKDSLEEESPSKLANRIGRFFDLGLIGGLTDLQNEVKMASKDVSSSIIDPIEEAVNNADTYFGRNLDVNPVITPILDISNIASGMSEVSSMFERDRKFRADAQINSWSNPDVRTNFLDTFANRIGEEYADRVVDAITNKDMNANVTLEGDAGKLFKVVKQQNRAFIRRTGYSGI